MGDLSIDAAVAGGNGRYTGDLSPEWAAWGPNGGYIAAILARAARAHGSLSRVASMSCHFVSMGRFAPVELDVVSLRRAKTAESVRCTMRQDGTAVAEGLVWLAADGLDGLRHDVAVMPDVPGPESLHPIAELNPDPDPPFPPMWNNIECRPTIWYENEQDRPLGEPYYSAWYRFQEHSVDDVSRQLVLLDVLAWGSAWSAHPADCGYIAPNLDLNVQFHRSATDEEWLFAEGITDVAEDGLIGFRTRVWSRERRLLASGSGQLLCRPDPSVAR